MSRTLDHPLDDRLSEIRRGRETTGRPLRLCAFKERS
jgi:hypothetical protein